ncbi:MAG TPA: imidazole glycerol phosphate synthase subunit HisH [Chthoniobacteraceae bacterium]|nr:imidazole glycerol phosphate synthase subunit HisH [Chthoniobacteraceae bacterium]
MIALIDYGSGNLRSVSKALEHEGADVRLVDSPPGIEGADAVVLPGVGAFGDCVRNLRERGLWEPISQWLADGKPFLGICLGYQLLFESSEETPGVKGFGYFRGQVKRFHEAGLKIPHMGWNSLERNNHPLWAGLPANPYVFFVHSYFPVPDDASIVTSRTTYGETFAASVARDNVAAVQFHPEKSQEIGLAILRNFIRSIPVEKTSVTGIAV